MARPFTLVQLRHFSAVATRENITAAAAELNVTQSALSSSIAQLEQAFGVQLFVRVPRRGVRLTPAGSRLLRECGALVEDADRLAATVRGEGDDVGGELVVGVFGPLASFRAPVLLQEFEARHPRVRLSFLEGDQEEIRRALLAGRCEVALVYELGIGEEFATEVVERVPAHVVVAADHPLAQRAGRRVSLHELAEEPMILLDLPHTREYLLRLFEGVGITPRVRHRAEGYETVRSFVGRGHGYAVLNQRLEHDRTHAGGRVVVLEIVEEVPAVDVLLVRVAGLRPTRRALAFAAVCRELLAPAGSAAV